MSTITVSEMDVLVESGEAVYLGKVGHFMRPVYRIDGSMYRQFLRFVNGKYVPGEFYQVRNEQAVLSILVKE